MRVRVIFAAALPVVATACNAPQPNHAETVAAAVTAAVVTQAPSLLPSPATTAVPRASASPAATAAASAGPSASPAPSGSPAPKHHVFSAPMRPPDAPPHIYAVQINTTDVGSGDTLWGKVLTSSNVASVEVRVATYGIGLQKVGVGRFTLAYRLGSVPFFVRGTYPMRIIARNTRGDATERSLSLTIH